MYLPNFVALAAFTCSSWAHPFSDQHPLISSSIKAIQNIQDEDWAALNKSVGGKLFSSQPVASPCYSNYDGKQKSTDCNACRNVYEQSYNDKFVAGQFSGYYNGNWAACLAKDEACTLPLNSSAEISSDRICYQGSIPQYYIDCHSIDDIQKGTAFAHQHGIPLVVKNSGHDASGRSAGPVSLALWTHHQTPPIEMDHDFIPKGCSRSTGPAVIFGSGQKFEGLHSFAEDNNITVIGGICGSVGASGGWLAAGGHSPLSPVYGLGVDNVQQFRVMLANGSCLAASRCHNQDMFFALAGGGGNTYGVVTEVTTKAHPQISLQDVNFDLGDLNESRLHELLKIMVTQATKLADAGWGGYIHPKRAKRTVTLINPLIDHRTALQHIQPIIEFAEMIGGTYTIQTRSSWYEYYHEYYEEQSWWNATWSSAPSSRLVPYDNFATVHSQNVLVGVLDAIMKDPVDPVFMLTTPIHNKGDDYTSVHPGWRNAVWLVSLSTRWDQFYEHTPEVVHSKFARVHESMDRLRKITPGSGSWFGEADVWEPDVREAFWGNENYEKLLETKKFYDPQNMLQVYQGVGWEPDNDLFKCYIRQ